jgi:hypothetical protein
MAEILRYGVGKVARGGGVMLGAEEKLQGGFGKSREGDSE